MSKGHWFREYYEAILVAVIFTLFARTFVAQAFKIPTGSMEDNLLVGDHLFVNKFIYAPHWRTPLHALMPYRDVRRADVVVFKYPQEPERDFIKRAVAVAGDLVEVRAEERDVNGRPEINANVVHKDPQLFPDSPLLPPSVRSRDNFGPDGIRPGTCSAWATTGTTPMIRASGVRFPRATSKARRSSYIGRTRHRPTPTSGVAGGIA